MTIQTPVWVKHAVFYQIFPDRFARSPRTNHPPGVRFKPWGSPPEEQGFQGGDLLGIVDKLDYLQDLGINAIYLNPIFSSAVNHRYHTFDYLQVDPLLGGNAALRELLDQAHARDIRVVLDGVFNHASRGFWPFHHILETGKNSPYLDWFIIHGWPLRPYASDDDHLPNYECWWSLPGLPKINTNNPGARQYLFDVARYWIDFGIDGWRLDVPFEMDHGFWQEFRQVVKSANPQAYLCGEIWWEAQRWLQGDQFDAVMNYIFCDLTLSFFGAHTLRPDFEQQHLDLKPLDARAFARRIDDMHALYDWEVNHVQLNLLDSHDMPRALWIMGEDKSALRLSALFQMTTPGAPCIYYGDEIGLSSDGDPHCRAAFPWDDAKSWDQSLLNFYQQATALRHRYPVLRTGDFRPLHAGDGVYAFQRTLGRTAAVAIFNTGPQPTRQRLALPDAQPHPFDLMWPAGSRQKVIFNQGHIEVEVPAREAVVLIQTQA